MTPLPSPVRRLLSSEGDTSTVVYFSEATQIPHHSTPVQRLLVLTHTHLYTVTKRLFGRYTVKKAVPLECVIGLVRNTQTTKFVVKVKSSFPNDYLFEGDCILDFTTALLTVRPKLDVWTLAIDVDLCVRRKSVTVCESADRSWHSRISDLLMSWRGVASE